MDKVDLNPLYVIFLYVLRCLVPLGIMLAISYLLRRFGLIKEPPPPPENWNNDQNNNGPAHGGIAHG
jgi:hypothetical protein